jgi:predicted ATP-grasp superfamily ATP-dependent carboligase
MQRLYDKEEQMRAAWRTNVDTPLTVFIRSADDLAAGAETIPFPAIFKPVMSLEFKKRFRRPVLVVDSPSQLEEVYARAADCGVLMLQEIVPGGDDELYTVGSTLDEQSRPLAVFTGRKLRQHPRTFGTARLAEGIWIEELADAGLRLLRELGYHGVSQVEFKRDHRDGKYKLMEVNARHWLWHGLAPASGVNLTLASYADAIGMPFQAPRQKDGRKWVLTLKEGVDSLNEMRHGQQRPGPWLRSLRGIRVDGVMACDDPLPGAVNAWRMGRVLLRRRAGLRTGPRPAEEIEL